MSKAMPDDEMVSWLLFYTGYSIRFISEFVGSGFQHIAFSCTNIFAAIADMRARGQKTAMPAIPANLHGVVFDILVGSRVACRAVARGRAARLRRWLRRGSLHSLRERRLVGPAGLEPATRPL